jgi:predicted GNAT family acetyltransferase
MTTVRDNSAAAQYELLDDTGAVIGLVQYALRGDSIALTHTETAASLAGQGVGSGLVSDVLDDARARGLSVLPYCPFVLEYIEHHPDYLDLVPVGVRENFGLPAAAAAEAGA